MNITITPGPLSGTIQAIPSKSDLHRALICAAFADAPTKILLSSETALSEDIAATLLCLHAFGARAQAEEGCILIQPRPENAPALPEHPLDCSESGSTLRFLLPIAAAVFSSSEFTGHGRLPSRPLSPLKEELEAHGCTFSAPQLPFTLTGLTRNSKHGYDPAGNRLPCPNGSSPVQSQSDPRSGENQPQEERMPEIPCFTLPGNISSQYISGLLLAAPLMGGVKITLTTKLESAPYAQMTIRTMAAFGISVEKTSEGFFVRPGGYHSPGVYEADGDWSNGAFFLAANALSEKYFAAAPLRVSGLFENSPQGDKAIAGILRAFSKKTAGAAEIDVSAIPDLVPILAVIASVTPGETVITGAARLRIKESDRLMTTCALITSLGGYAKETENGLRITGRKVLSGGTVNSYNDHRIAMAAAVASIACTAPVTILDAGATAKSYPAFWEDFIRLGGRIKDGADISGLQINPANDQEKTNHAGVL